MWLVRWMFHSHLRTSSIVLCTCLAVAGDAWAADTFDGVYLGKAFVTRANNDRGCGADDVPVNSKAVVKHNKFSRKWSSIMLHIEIAEDGSFSSSAYYRATKAGVLVVTIEGRIVGDDLEADIGHLSCQFHLSLRRS